MTPEDTLIWEGIEVLSARIHRLERIHAVELQNIEWRKKG